MGANEHFGGSQRRKGGRQQEILSDNGSHESRHSNQMLWSEMLNMNFNTQIFSQNNDYILELGNIYGAKALIDSALSQIIPNVKNYKNLA